MIKFRQHNLIVDDPKLGMFDVIFCRNVLIYFDDDTKRTVLARLASHLAADGYLVLGAAETVTGLSRDFAAVREGHHGIFTLGPEARAARAKGQGAGEARASAGHQGHAVRACAGPSR